MKPTPNIQAEMHRIEGPARTNYGAFTFHRGNACLRVIASAAGGWEHVSVSLRTRCPTWEEMCYVKGIFFGEEETVMQLHPPKSQYVNHHPYCLHLWRPQTQEEMEQERELFVKSGGQWDWGVDSPGTIPLPPMEFVGPQAGVPS